MLLFLFAREHSVILATKTLLSSRKLAAQMLPWAVQSLTAFFEVIPYTEVLRSSLGLEESL